MFRIHSAVSAFSACQKIRQRNHKWRRATEMRQCSLIWGDVSLLWGDVAWCEVILAWCGVMWCDFGLVWGDVARCGVMWGVLRFSTNVEFKPIKLLNYNFCTYTTTYSLYTFSISVFRAILIFNNYVLSVLLLFWFIRPKESGTVLAVIAVESMAVDIDRFDHIV